LYLVGFMAAGKSAVARGLAATLGWRLVDLDEAIERDAGLSVRRVFELYGERVFRGLEQAALQRCARSRPGLVVALGGGAFANRRSRVAIRRSGVSIWLDAPFRVLVRRLANDHSRPLARDTRRLYQLYRARLPAYHGADLRVRIGSRGIEAVLVEVERRLRSEVRLYTEDPTAEVNC
jgi:shikimate kinase